MTVSEAAPERLSYKHASGLHAVTRALGALHLQLLRANNEEMSPVRTSVMNLVAAGTDAADADRAARVFMEIGAHHPVRAIVAVADPEGDPRLEADISLHCAADSTRVCMELVRLDVHGEPAFHLTSIVTPLLVPDMPVQLWVVGAPRLVQAFSKEAVVLTERIILDSGAYPDPAQTLRLISEQLQQYGHELVVADMAWERIRVWREAVALSFEPADARALLHGIREVSIDCTGERPPADALLLVGWLGARLRWQNRSAPKTSIRAGDVGPDDGVSALTRVTVAAGRGRHRGTVVVQRSTDSLETAIHVEGAMTTSRTIALRAQDEASLISALLTEGGDDSIYRESVATAVTLAHRVKQSHA